jgi:tripartite-type tricarboxylate transporter receptor subunit TctC
MRFTKVGLAAVLLACGAAIVHAQEKYPSRPIEFIVPWGPGGGADQVARKSSQLMEKDLGVSLPVINVPGATGQTGLTKMLTSAPDGYTISVMTGDTFGLLTDSATKWKFRTTSSRRRS